MPDKQRSEPEELTLAGPLVYNAAMDIPTSILYSVISAIAEAALTPAPEPQIVHEAAALPRALPEEARQGLMQPPAGDGFLTINGQQWPLAPAAQFRNRQNLIVMPMRIQSPVEVVYLTNGDGAIHRVWMLTPGEAAVSRPR
ncbi:MAG: hypothetical protein JNK99_00385 [Candidatus Accumulibacter sp.]|uniref:hypothetical protein n=1 Tax=Accumulibacter sp. TaxID=2053492 RepID=UPI001A633C3C|nr:hypothetical protein [Accumulibacter sp.]MBL8393194.1 hypothetical protein [Accumulibacter sp.]